MIPRGGGPWGNVDDIEKGLRSENVKVEERRRRHFFRSPCHKVRKMKFLSWRLFHLIPRGGGLGAM